MYQNGKSTQPRSILNALQFPLGAVLCAIYLSGSPAEANPSQPREQPRQAGAPHAAPPQPKEQPRQTGGTHANPLANDLEALSASAEDTFELAMSGKMDRLPKKFELVKRTVAALPVIQDESSSNLLPHLRHTMTELEQAVTAKDRLDVMRFANRVSLIATTLAVPLKPCVPTEVALLDYNARELVIWSELRRNERLSSIVIRMHLTWQALMPKLVDKNATKELKRFSELMGHLEAAKTPEEFGRVSRQLSGELNVMKVIFAKSSSR